MNLISPFDYLAQKLLYLWINTDVAELTHYRPNDKDTKIIYVLESRAWSDLLVLEEECTVLHITRPRSRIKHQQLKQWHNVYTVAQKKPLKSWLQNKAKRSRMLCGIYAALKENPDLDVHFVPVVIFWGRPVSKQKHWFHVLFSDTWGLGGRTRKFFTILFNGKNTLIQFSPAISFRELIDGSPQQNNAVDDLQTILSERLEQIKSATLGPDISHRRTLISKLLVNNDIENAIKSRAEKDNSSILQATKIADNYLKEIVADRSYITIQLLQRILTTFWNKFYSGIDVHFSASLKSLALTHELVYVPCHRSHIDYLLLSYVIHNEGLAIPYIAAGKNLNMPIVGPVLRKAGAFFIRRSFKDNELYSTVMFEYLASQISSGMPVEYFIEGGRSRTGRLLQPKPGMLAMTVRSFLKYQQRPIAFIPVYIGYEKMIEGKAYLAELTGDDKKSETLIGSIRSFFGIRGFYGRVTTSFGQAVLLNDILTNQYSNWKAQTYDDTDRPEWLKPVVNQTSQLIMQGINESCAVNAVNLIATALLAAPNQTMDEGELKQTLSLYIKLIQDLNYADRITVTSHDANQQIQLAENLGLIKRRKHEMGDFLYLDKANAILLTYYRNNSLHLFALPSLIACCFNNASDLDNETISHYIKVAYPFLKTEFFLPWEAADIQAIIDKTLTNLSHSGVIVYDDETKLFSRPVITTAQHAQHTTLAQVISPLLELYYMIFALLAEHSPSSLTRTRLEELCHLMAQRLSLMYEINSPDFFDKKLINNFINSLLQHDYVYINQSNYLELSDTAINEGLFARRLLDKNMQYNILQMLRSSSTDV